MPNRFFAKLDHGSILSPEDRTRLEQVVSRVRQVGARETLIHQGDRPDDVHLVVDGFAFRYKTLPNGERQIMALLVPGDFCDLQTAVFGEMDHSVGTLTPCTILEIPHAAIDDLTARHPGITRALWWATLVDEATLREWLVNMGQRPADRQMAHFFCELFVRLQAVGLAKDNGLELPLTQEELGDTLGLSTVHVNRVLQQLRSDGLIVLRGKMLSIPDFAKLKAFAGFDPSYLHIGSKGIRVQRAQDAAKPAIEKK